MIAAWSLSTRNVPHGHAASDKQAKAESCQTAMNAWTAGPETWGNDEIFRSASERLGNVAGGSAYRTVGEAASGATPGFSLVRRFPAEK